MWLVSKVLAGTVVAALMRIIIIFCVPTTPTYYTSTGVRECVHCAQTDGQERAR